MANDMLQKMDFSTDFINEELDLYPLMGGTHYGSGSNERFGGVICAPKRFILLNLVCI